MIWVFCTLAAYQMTMDSWLYTSDDLHSLVVHWMAVESLAECQMTVDSLAAHQITVDSLAVCSTSDDSGQFGSMQYIR